MIKKILYIVAGSYVLIWLFVFGTGGGTQSDTNQKQLEQTVRYYQEISDDLFLMAEYVEQRDSTKETRPREAELIEWVEARGDISNHVKNFHLTLHFENYPEHVLNEYGTPTSDGFAIDLWTGDQHLFYASWVDTNSANVSIEDFGISRTHSLLHVFAGLLAILSVYLIGQIRVKKSVASNKHKP